MSVKIKLVWRGAGYIQVRWMDEVLDELGTLLC